jgi:hypothetical protein
MSPRDIATILVPLDEQKLPHNNCSAGDFAACASAVGARAALAARRAEMLGVAKVDQRIEAGHGFEDDVAALSAIASIGSAELDELFAPEADRAGTARAGADENLGLVEEMHCGAAVRR